MSFRIDKRRSIDTEALTPAQHASRQTELGRPVTDHAIGGTRQSQAKRRLDALRSDIAGGYTSPLDEHLPRKETT